MSRYFLVLTLAAAAYGQAESDALSITASRTSGVLPDRLYILAYATAPANVTLDNVLAALEGTGIKPADFIGAGAVQRFPGQAEGDVRLTEWGFVLSAPLTNLQNALTALENYQPRSNVKLYFSAQSGPPAAPPCSWQVLLGDAHTQAQRVATAANVRLGPIVALSDNNESAPLIGIGGVFYPILGRGSLLGNTSAPTCSLTVRYKILR